MKKYPFKFLDSYTQNDTDIFFGRDEEIETLYEMVFQNPILLVYGASGTGKTSLIQCGLAGKFKSYDWLALTIRRGTDINVSLEKALTDAGGNDLDEEDLQSKDHSKKLSPLLQLIKGIYLNSFKPIYLIFDQFEELYVLGTKDEQEKFIGAVKEVLTAEQAVKMIFSIREEYLGHLYEFEKQVPQLLRKKLRVEPMTLDKVTDVIKGINNFELSNVTVKPDEINMITQGIFDRIKGKKKTLSIQLPYLQVFLDKLYLETTKDESRRADAFITMDTLNRIGDIGDVLRHFLEEQVAKISSKLSAGNKDASTDTVWKILSPFSTLEGTKKPLSKKEVSDRLPEINKDLVNECVEAFVTSRILNYSENSNLYELAHDSLALRIAEKRTDEEIALLEVRRLIKNQVSIKAEARETFSEKQINFIEPFLGKLKLDQEEQMLVEQSKISVAKQKNKRKRRLQLTFTGMTVAVAIMIGLSVWAVRQKNTSEDALKGQLEEKQKAFEAKQRELEAIENQNLSDKKAKATEEKNDNTDFLLSLGNASKMIDGGVCPEKDLQVLKKIAEKYPDAREHLQKIQELRKRKEELKNKPLYEALKTCNF